MKKRSFLLSTLTIVFVTLMSACFISCSDKKEEIIPPIIDDQEEMIDYTIDLVTSRQTVDLGLPSGTLWASMNVGASSNASPGGYYRWGETKEIFMVHSETPYTCDYEYEYYDANGQTKYIDIGRDISGTQYDVAQALWGQNWKMPTLEQFMELWQNCKHGEYTLAGQKGHVFVGKNGNKIFLPYGGNKSIGGIVSYYPYEDKRTISLLDSEYFYYWTSSRYDGENAPEGGAWMISNYFNGKAFCGRSLANNVRPVYSNSGGSSSTFDASLLIGTWKTTFEGNEYSIYKFKEDKTFINTGIGGGESYKDVGTWSLNTNTKILTLTYSDGSKQEGEIVILTATELVLFDCVYLRTDENSDNSDDNSDEIDKDNDSNQNHDYVDLALPSGTLWATMNLGAKKPEDYGDYFAWGETVGYNNGKTEFSDDTYRFYDPTYSYHSVSKYCTDSYYGNVDNRTELEPEDDAATNKWGSDWQMPSNDQFAELINNNYTTTIWTTLNGIRGRKIVSKKNGNSIFLPAAGTLKNTSLQDVGSFANYWSRSLESYCFSSSDLDFGSNYIHTSFSLRYHGQSVRPVRVQK